MTRDDLDNCYIGKERRKGCEFADAAADRVVKRTFGLFGIDIEKLEDVEKCRKVFHFVETAQKWTSKGSFIAFSAFIIIMVGATVTTFWEGLATKIGKLLN